jgi:hypothetical protein
VVVALLVFGLAALAVPAPAADTAPVTDADVNADIAAMKAFFYAHQVAYDADTAGWEDAKAAATPGAGGPTALNTLALLVAGDSEQRPEIVKALNFLRGTLVQTDKIKSPDGKYQPVTTIYKASLLAHVWAHLPEAYNPLLVAQESAIEDYFHNGACHYYANQTDFDHSTTQYGVLGLWEAAKRGVHLKNPALWESIFEHFKKTQLPHGGWAYSVTPAAGAAAEDAATQSMTCAGLTSLLVAQQEALRTQANANEDLGKIVQKGLAWLDKYFVAGGNPGESHG